MITRPLGCPILASLGCFESCLNVDQVLLNPLYDPRYQIPIYVGGEIHSLRVWVESSSMPVAK